MLKTITKGCEPKKGTENSACIDLFSAKDITIGAGETVLVPLGVKIDLAMFKINMYGGLRLEKTMRDTNDRHFKRFLKTHQLNLHIRSSMSAKYGLIISNGTGIIDMDYEGEIMICLHNPLKLKGNYALPIKKGEKIAQISLIEHKSYLFGVESDNKRDGGFGSTGK